MSLMWHAIINVNEKKRRQLWRSAITPTDWYTEVASFATALWTMEILAPKQICALATETLLDPHYHIDYRPA